MKHSLPFVYYVYYGKEAEMLTQLPRDGYMWHGNLSVPAVGNEYWMNVYFTWWIIEWWFIFKSLQDKKKVNSLDAEIDYNGDGCKQRSKQTS